MRILSLFFKNINSLEGESRIHFDRPPIVDGGVFAITGPNGSGKSTVLDAITLGLYGETFRFDRPAQHVMTKATTESFVEVEFALGDNKFRSSWQVNRKDDQIDGELTAPEMKLIQLNGDESESQTMEQTAVKVRDRVAELIGMDFHKFSKSMVLAQGDFAAFLNALDSERMDILEKISGVDIYASYKQQAEEKFNQAQIRLQQIEQDLNIIPVMDATTKEAREHDLADFKQQQFEFKTELDEVQQQLAETQKISALNKQIEVLTQRQQQQQVQLQENQQTLDKILGSEDLMQFAEELVIVDTKTESTQQSRKTLDSYLTELEMLHAQLKAANFDENTPVTDKSFDQQKTSVDELKLKLSELKFDLPKESALFQTLTQKINEKKSTLLTTADWLKDHAADESLVNNFPETGKLKILRTELAELTVKQKSYSKWSKTTQETLKNKKARVVELKEDTVYLKGQINGIEKSLQTMADGHSSEDLQDMQIEQQQRIDNFQELYELANVNAKLGHVGFFAQIFGSKNINKEEIDLIMESERVQLELGREQNIVKTLELTVTNEALLKKMQPDRQFLVDGKACPLCGALDHPYAKYTPAVSNSTQALNDQRKKVKELIAKIDSLKKQIALLENQAVKAVQKDSQLLNVRAQWSGLVNRLNVASMDLDINNLSLMKDKLLVEKKELSNIVNLQKQFVKQLGQISQHEQSIESKSVLLKRLIEETELLQAEWDDRPVESIDLEKAYSQCLADEKLLAEKVLEQLKQLSEKLPKKGKEEVLFERLNARRQEYQTRVMRQKSLTEEIQLMEQQLNVCSNKIDQVNYGIQQCSEHVQKEELAGLHLSLIEKQKLIADKEIIYAQQQTELTDLKQSLQDRIKHITSADLNELRELLALIKGKSEIEQKQLELSQSLDDIEKQLMNTQVQLEAGQSSLLTAISEEELLEKQQAIKEKLDIAEQEINSLQNQLSNHANVQEKYDQVLAKVESQQAIFDVCQSEIELINNENGIHFRTKVQQQMADKLLSQANQILEKLSGRYYVRKVVSEHGLAIEIEDTKQNNVRRLPKTLSGGESFIVSLALALALAEMANNGHAVDSLFLDEGFGTLDSESLYLAMTTLESLKTHGKIVGVISHVEGVRKRIKTQIEMSKKPNGLSALKVIS
ncbi:MAG: chromosome segregation protein SMC [Methylococcales bacterium]|nr:chromosome segregation protein SMC [Methylococcales bacterium]